MQLQCHWSCIPYKTGIKPRARFQYRIPAMSNKLLIFGLIAWVGARLGETKVVPELQVKLNSGGSIRGQYMVSHKGRGIRAFKNIPYAEPPIGSLRFADPVPKAPWKDDLTLSTDSILCPQVDNVYGVGMFMGQEDCLYLNVYAPLVGIGQRN